MHTEDRDMVVVGMDGKDYKVTFRINRSDSEWVYDDYILFQRYRVPVGGALIVSPMGTPQCVFDADRVNEELAKAGH